jgi:two-component system OmpR family sensor kinase
MIAKLRALPERVPLRVTLVAASLLLVAVSLGASGETAIYLLRSKLTDRIDSQLHSASEYVAASMSGLQANGRVVIKFLPAEKADIYYWVGDNDGVGESAIERYGNSAERPPALPKITKAFVESQHDKPFNRAAEGNPAHRWRLLATVLPNDTQVIVVGFSLASVEDTVSKVGSTLLLVDAAVLAALAVVGFGLVQASLRRLQEVERTAQAIAAGDLTRRVPSGHPETEVGRLSAAFNAMVGEIETAFRARESSEYEARASEARMRRFAADASHELRTPLTSIRGFAELYRQGGGDPAHVIGRIEHHAARMGALVEDLLLLARLDQQRPLERVPVDLLTLAADAVQDAAATAPSYQIALRAYGDQPPVVLGDELHLRQVIGNLLTNAVRHTPPGTAVTVTVSTVEDSVVLEVADNGPGLAPEDADRVFERFFRTDPARTRERGGTGLGLSIVQALVAAHGGNVSLASAPGAGARFAVRLPLYEAPDLPEESSSPDRQPSGSAYPASSQAGLGKLGHDADRDSGRR